MFVTLESVPTLGVAQSHGALAWGPRCRGKLYLTTEGLYLCRGNERVTIESKGNPRREKWIAQYEDVEYYLSLTLLLSRYVRCSYATRRPIRKLWCE